MSRSRKKKMGGGITSAFSEKRDKKRWHRSFRTVNKTILNHYDNDGETNFKTVKEMSDPWAMDKDGKYVIAESEIRSLVDAVLTEAAGQGNVSRGFNGRGYPAANIYRELCFYLKKKKKNIRQISDFTKNQFIKYYINKEKRK